MKKEDTLAGVELWFSVESSGILAEVSSDGGNR